VLLGVEPAPLRRAQLRDAGTEDALRARVAIGDDGAGDLVVAVVLAEATVVGVDRGRGVAPLGQPAQRLVLWLRVVAADLEDPAGVERVALRVEGVAGVLDERDRGPREERDVVEAGVRFVARVEEAKRAGVGTRAALAQLEDRAPTARFRVLDAFGVGVTRLVEEELGEMAARLEDAVLRALERVAFAALASGSA
jgi:hypothetical protein